MGEINQNPMPEIRVLPDGVERAFDLASRVVKYGRRIIKNTNIQFLPNQPLASSEYPKHPERRGAAAMLDAALDDNQLTLEFED